MKKLVHIQWNSSYSVGYNYIDNQHKRLVDIVNTFYDAVKGGNKDNLPYTILNNLISYAEEHFIDEEIAMEQAGCPEELVSEHRAIHETLVKDIFEVTEKVTAESTDQALTEVGELLRRWLLEHILDEDMRYAPYVSKLKGPIKKEKAL